MRSLIVAVGLLAAGTAAAENVRDISPFTQALFRNMGVNWTCRNEIGEINYQTARTIAVQGLAKYVGRDQATLHVDELDRKFKADTRTFSVTAARCYELKADAMHQINVEKAKLEAE